MLRSGPLAGHYEMHMLESWKLLRCRGAFHQHAPLRVCSTRQSGTHVYAQANGRACVHRERHECPSHASAGLFLVDIHTHVHARKPYLRAGICREGREHLPHALANLSSLAVRALSLPGQQHGSTCKPRGRLAYRGLVVHCT